MDRIEIGAPGGTLLRVRPVPAPPPPAAPGPPPVRLAYAAAHVVIPAPGSKLREPLDWERTLAFRRRLWSLGLGVAEAMDTAQRDQIGPDLAAELMDRTLAESRALRGSLPWTAVMGGAGPDGLRETEPSLSRIIDEYVRQGRFIQERGGDVILLSTPFLTRRKARPEDYVEVYGQVVRQLAPPVYLHWLGEMFAPALAGYFPGDSFDRIMEENADHILGVKLSVLDEAREIELRRRLLPRGQIVLTGDDFNYPRLIEGAPPEKGAEEGPFRTFRAAGREFPLGDFSHALLGVFDAIAPVAAAGLERLALGDREGWRRLMNPTEALGRKLFEPPTRFYKAGVVFLAYLNGRQDHFGLFGGMESERSREHYLEVFRLAAECGAIEDFGEAVRRLRALFG